MTGEADRSSTAPLSPWVLRGSAWSLATASAAAYLWQKAGQPSPPQSVLDGTFLWVALALYLLPFIRSIKLGKLLELERELDRSKEETRSLKEDVRQQIALLTANVTAVATNIRTTINNYVYQGEERNPARLAGQPDVTGSPPRQPLAGPGVPATRTPTELKILNTLWVKQVNKFEDVATRFTIRIDYAASSNEAHAYESAVAKLLSEGLIARSPENQFFLTDAGLRYCRDHHRTFPRDIWFEQEAVDDARLAKIVAKIPE